MQSSMMWFLQIAQLSTTMSQAQSATAFHFLISNRLAFLAVEEEDEEEGGMVALGPFVTSLSRDAIGVPGIQGNFASSS